MARKTRGVRPAVQELEGIDLGDARLNERAKRIVEALARNPAAGFPTAVDTIAEREAVYRLLGNERVIAEELLAPHAAQTAARMAALPSRPLVIVDKTSFVFSGESERDGVERLGDARHGFDAFFALGASVDRTAAGVLSILPLEARPRRGTAAEWEEAIESAASHADKLKPIYVMDREADAFALMASLAAKSRDFVIRVSDDRWVKEHDDCGREMLRTVATRAPTILRRNVLLSRRSRVGTMPDQRKVHPPRAGREANLALRTIDISLPRPPRIKAPLPELLRVTLVHVIEENPPKGEPPVEWLLLTSLNAADAASVGYVVDCYRARWTIEEYFKALKSGCSYEKRQLESRHALLNALALLAPLAWRLLSLRSAGEETPNSAALVLDAEELHILRTIARDVKLPAKPSAAEVLNAVARIGGHFPQNGRPGWKVIWAGFMKLIDRAAGYRQARSEM